jgi:hypothetical protein
MTDLLNFAHTTNRCSARRERCHHSTTGALGERTSSSGRSEPLSPTACESRECSPMAEGDFLPEYEAIKARWTGNGLAEAKILDLGEWDAGEDEAPIPPRKWLLGNLFCR